MSSKKANSGCPDDPQQALAWIQNKARILADSFASGYREQKHLRDTHQYFDWSESQLGRQQLLTVDQQDRERLVVDLYNVTLRHIPHFVDRDFQRHCQGPQAAADNLDAATEQWERLHLEACKRLARPADEIHGLPVCTPAAPPPEETVPMTKKQIAEKIGYSLKLRRGRTDYDVFNKVYGDHLRPVAGTQTYRVNLTTLSLSSPRDVAKLRA